MAPRKTVPVRYSIRTKLLFLFLGLTTVALIVSSLLAISTIFTATNNSQQISQSTLKNQAADFMVQIIKKTAQQNDLILEAVRQDANSLAFFASDIYANSQEFYESSHWRAETSMITGNEGQYANGENDIASVFVPNTVAINENLTYNLELSSQIDYQLRAIYESSENITAVYYGSEDEITRYYPNINLGAALPPDFKVTQRPWYTNAVQENPEKMVAWSEIYEDATGQGLLVTAAIPVYHANKLAGVIGIDVSLEDIQKTVEETQLFDNSYSFLIDETGQIIVLPEQGYLDILGQGSEDFNAAVNLTESTNSFESIITAMIAKESGFKEIKAVNDILFVAYAPLQSTGWSLATVVPESQLLKAVTILQAELTENTRQLVLTRLISLGLLLLVFTIVVGFWATNQLVNPIQNLARAVQKIGAGEWEAPLPKISNDEIGVLSSTFQSVTTQLHHTLENLEMRVNERTKDLEDRVIQLRAAAQVAQDTLAIQDVRALLTKVTQLISERFNYYHAGIFLLDTHGEYAVLHAASSEGGQRMLEQGHRLRVGSEGIVGATAVARRPHIAHDVGSDAVYFDNPDLPQTRSEMALPLLIKDEVIGILDIQSTESQAFSQQDVEILLTLANQVSLAIQNARLSEEAQVNIAQLETFAAEQTKNIWGKRLKNQSRGFFYTPLGITPLTTDQNLNGSGNKEQFSDAPIVLRGKKIGNIALKRGSRQWTKKEKALISEVSNQVALAIENSRLVSETREQANRDKIITQFSSKLRETLDMDIIVKTALEEIKKTFGLDEAEVRLSIPDENRVED